MNHVSQKFLDAAISGDQRSITTVEAWTGPTANSQPSKIVTLGTVTAGTWSEDETRSPRRQCSLTAESQGLPYDRLVPQQAGDLLHPLTGNELRIFSGFRFSDGTQEVTSCGVYRMTKPKVTDTGDKVEITITGNDRSSEVERRSWIDPYPITGSPNLATVIHDAMDNRMPGLIYNLAPTDYTVPDVTFGTQGAAATTGPMTDLIGLATAAGMELFFDGDGILVMRPVPDPTASTIVLTFAEGADCTLTEIDLTLDESRTYNGAIVVGSGGGTAAPVRVEVWVTDPGSPLNPATFGYKPYNYASPFITTVAQATAVAQALLQLHLTAFDDTAFVASQNAALTCGDSIGLVRSRIGISDSYTTSQIQMSASVGTGMTVTNRARRSTS